MTYHNDYPESLEVIAKAGCDSTNNYIKKNYHQLKDKLPVLVTAALQTGGRGRDNRSWASTVGKGLYSSFGFTLDSSRNLHLLPLIAGISVIETLEKTVEMKDIKYGLKWPNDVLYRGKKIAGILIENTIFDRRMFCITGMGINLNHGPGDLPGDLAEKAVSLRMITGTDYKTGDINPLLANIFFNWLEKLKNNGGETIIQTANEYSEFLLGKTISFHQAPDKITSGIFRGINHDGGLILETGGGDIVTHYSGEVVQPPVPRATG
jgi:BirA family biotin operon repressor/biotin-[acetyl-CoA-carboxylase] ligase